MELACPKCGSKKFTVVAHVTEEWITDEKGNFLEVHQSCIDVIHKPDKDDCWLCAECGNEAIVREA